MRIVIDMQGAQTQGLSHGVGRHTMALVRALLENRNEHSVILALDGTEPGSVELIRAAFDGILRQSDIRVWYGLSQTEIDPDAEKNINRLIREAFLTELQADVIHFTGDFFDTERLNFAFTTDDFYRTPLLTASVYEYTGPETSGRALDRQEESIESVSIICINLAAGDPLAENPDVGSEPNSHFLSRGDDTGLVPAALGKKHAIYLPADLQNRIDWGHYSRKLLELWSELSRKPRFRTPALNVAKARKPVLAYVSPLPPERTGIADYSAELIPVLSKHYDIIVITDQTFVSDNWIRKNCQLKGNAWLKENSDAVDRVLYHVGNSQFHKDVPDLIKEISGTVVLHDFYLSGLYGWLENVAGETSVWTKALYNSHGYKAVEQRHFNPAAAQFKYPVNFEILSNAQGVIVHSEFSRRLAIEWYPNLSDKRWSHIPHLRVPAHEFDRNSARRTLGFSDNDFVVCSFGFLGETKLNDRLLEAWSTSALIRDRKCKLVFVGELPPGEYRSKIINMIEKKQLSDQVRITGFADPDTYRLYLRAADVAVQLRSWSRGETSGTILDCMNYALPLIANSAGSTAELDPSALVLLPEHFSNEQLSEALESLRKDENARVKIGSRARVCIKEKHAPEVCAEDYTSTIESFHHHISGSSRFLLKKLAEKIPPNTSKSTLKLLANSISKSQPSPRPTKTLFIDITATCKNDLKTGIERVARALTIEMLHAPPLGYRIEPIYLSRINGEWCYMHAHQYTASIMGIGTFPLHDDVAEICAGDIVLGLDISGEEIIDCIASGYVDHLRNGGTQFYFLVFDLLPVRMPNVFPPGADVNHSRWLAAVSSTDGVLGISRHVADDFSNWLQETGIHSSRQRSFRIGYAHLGADIDSSAPSKGLPRSAREVIRSIHKRSTFLMVGTIEPRKCYLQALEAFDKLWQNGVDVNLVIVGKEGWLGFPDDSRRNIPHTIERLRHHPERGKRLFWLEGISDEYLEQIYDTSTCLIAASEDEGFGLPLIESAQHEIPIIARDISVFREVAGDHAFYFHGREPEDLAHAIREWLILYAHNRHPSSRGMPWLTWKDSAQQVLNFVIPDNDMGKLD